MKTLVSMLILSVMGILALACASGSDIEKTQSAGFRSNRTLDGSVIPNDIYNAFKAIPGGNLTGIGQPNLEVYGNEDNAAVDRAFLASDYLVDQRISGFDMMETEVTVEMYVKFLNSAQGLIDKFSGSSSSFTFSSPSTLYRNPMSLSNYCGIVMKSGGESVLLQTSAGELAGFYIINDVVDPTLPKANPDHHQIDPFQQLQKARMMGEGSILTFSSAPKRGNYPMCFTSQSDAKEFCAWLGINYRLPTVYEWMYAAKGGNPNADFGTSTGSITNAAGDYLANIQGYATGAGSTVDVVANQTGANGYGLRDMSGSVYEWTYFPEEDQDAAGATLPNGGFRYIMGGSYGTTNFSGAALWNKGRISYTEGVFAADVGFRVLYSSNRAQTIASQELDPNNL